MIEYQKHILKQPGIPYKPSLSKDVVFKFRDGNRDKFCEMLKEAMNQRAWNVCSFPILIDKATLKSSRADTSAAKLNLNQTSSRHSCHQA